MSRSPSFPKLLAPAGNWDCAKAAVENGADAIYFGLDQFNARMRADNFTVADLPELMAFLHRRGVKGYVTLNTLVFTAELATAEDYLRQVITAGVDAAIVQDVGICRLIRHLSPDFPIHASTQMTVTSALGVEFARELGCELVVLARETSLKELDKIQGQLRDRGTQLPLEMFVHGALCVAYSGQCLTSEALGGRSANRGECAQACRMPYDLIVDGQPLDLGDRKYLLSPQDLAGLAVVPELVTAGVSCLKIEGRLKTPEYVASVTQVYRRALDRVWDSDGVERGIEGDRTEHNHKDERYSLEMAFSRGLYTGWFKGIDNQHLVHARFGKKRGVYLGEVLSVGKNQVTIAPQAPVQAGDGVVFDQGKPDQQEMGGRVYQVEPVKPNPVSINRKTKGQPRVKKPVRHPVKTKVKKNTGNNPAVQLTFNQQSFNTHRIHAGDKVWKTSDPDWAKQVRRSFAGEHPHHTRPIVIQVQGQVDEPLIAIAIDEQGHTVQTQSQMPLVAAHHKPLTTERLQQQLGRLGNTPFHLGALNNDLQGAVLVPVSELNRMRRELVTQLEEERRQPRAWQLQSQVSHRDLLPKVKPSPSGRGLGEGKSTESKTQLIVLVRNLAQLQAVLQTDITTIYCELEDPPKYREIVQTVRTTEHQPEIWIAPPRITKPRENYILDQVKRCQPDGYLVRNYDQLHHFADERCIGDFSLNVANPITAAYFKNKFQLERLTASYDLNATQLEDLLRAAPAAWFEVTIHQHMPMFHMEHCVFCAFLSEGKDFRDCGRPCEKHEVQVRDRVGTAHILQADAGCRNTVFNGVAQTGVEALPRLVKAGLQTVRLEFLNETPTQIKEAIAAYQQVLQGELTGAQLWRDLQLHSQLGVTRGSLEH